MGKMIDRSAALRMFDELSIHIARTEPGFSIRYKNESISQRVIAALVFVFNRHYMKRFITTIGAKVYFPDRDFVHRDPWQAVKILAHEYVHIVDGRRRLFWKLRYLGPNSLIGLALCVGTAAAVMLSAPWPVYLAWIAAVIPWPSAFRRDAELRGYSMNMLVNVWRHGGNKASTIEWIVEKFTGPAYFFMWPFRRDMQSRIIAIEGAITFRTIFNGDDGKPFADVIELFDREYERRAA